MILMNKSDGVFSGANNPTAAAKKTFTHEVGHALKLAHPAKNSSLSEHTYYGGIPYAVMNQGFPVNAVATTVSSHDKSCLIAKWGA